MEIMKVWQREKKWEKEFQFDLLAAFWLAIHKDCIQLVNFFMIYDIYLRQLVTLAMKGLPEKPSGFKSKR